MSEVDFEVWLGFDRVGSVASNLQEAVAPEDYMPFLSQALLTLDATMTSLGSD